MNEIEKILRKNTMDLFSDKWYFNVSEEILKNKKEQKGYVYFVKNNGEGIVKIGKSANLTSRLNNFATNFNPFLCGFIYCDNYDEIEKNLHIKLSEFRKNGEWFNIDDVNKLILENEGVIVNKFKTKKSTIIDGIAFNFDDKYNNNLDNYYSEFLEFLNNGIIKNDKIEKTLIYSEIKNLNSKYLNLSHKKITLIIKNWAKEKGLKYFDFNSNGKTYFIIQ